GLLTDKASETGDDSSENGNQPPRMLINRNRAPGGAPARGDGSSLTITGNDLTEHSTARPGEPPASLTKPKTRGGRPMTAKVPLTITWTKRMEFMGRSADLEGRPAAKAIFYGTVVADIEDGRIRCEDHMITYADKEVPLKQISSMADRKKRGNPQAAEMDA